jgi:GTP cyclohydrolase I
MRWWTNYWCSRRRESCEGGIPHHRWGSEARLVALARRVKRAVGVLICLWASVGRQIDWRCDFASRRPSPAGDAHALVRLVFVRRTGYDSGGMKTPVLLPDVAAETDPRGVALHAVGICGLRLPVQLCTPTETVQQVVAVADLSVDIEATQRGAHMSRLVEALYEWASAPRTPAEVNTLLHATRDRLNSRSAQLRMRFPYFLQVPAPVTQTTGWLDVEVEWDCRLNNGASYAISAFVFPAMTLCPCSKAISDYGAHNQRALARIWLQTKDNLLRLPDEYLPMVQESVSSLVYPVLKRPDEKFVTEHSYENPRFVEDVARELALRLSIRDELRWFRVECESIESIHNHNAFAMYESPKRK